MKSHLRRVNILYYCTLQMGSSPTDNIQVFEYLNTRTEIFKHLNGSAFKYSDNSIGHSNI